ncbi:MAG: oligosaccharide flippase family protein [Candidatus Delongbacteria bacterium]|nr:oligosaccharide flippase family protein [Candidatus Delongbacteria bacterium]
MKRIKIKTFITNLFKKKKIKQISVLYSSTIIGIFIGLFTSVITTRFLGPENYGDYKFIHSVYSFFSLIISFGLSVSAGRLLADKSNQKIRKELIGSSIIITSVLGILFLLSIIIFAYFQSYFFPKDLKHVFILLAPLMFIIPFKMSFEYLFQGDNKIYQLAIFRQVPPVLYVLSLLMLNKFDYLSVVSATSAELITFSVIVILLSIQMKPKFIKIKENVKIILNENKTYGLHVYAGSLIGVASTHFGPIILSYFSDTNIDVGYYSLANVVTIPLIMIPNIVGTTMFKEFASRKSIPLKATRATIGMSVLSLVGYILFAKSMVLILYSEKYIEAVPLIYIVALGQIFHGFGNYYNRFLGAHGQGKILRNGAMYVGIANLLGFVFLIPILGAYGAALTQLFSGFVFTLSLYTYYRIYINKIKSENFEE